MDTESEFDELAGIRPGVTTLGQLRELLGDADELSPSTNLPNTGESRVFLRFTAIGIAVLYTHESDAENTTIDEVRLLNGNDEILQCGLHIGMARQEATELIRRVFAVMDEYDDSIYFAPSRKRWLGACAEFMGESTITSLELYIDDAL